MAADLGRLETVEPRTVWLHEAHDFTPWLLQNPDRLAEALGIDVEFDASEHAVGGFSLDLIGRDLTNEAVLIVENQLEPTDHLHLGQVLTYAAGTNASTIVWIATKFREEHRRALDWLNENTGEDIHFFGLELQVVRIGESPPAPLLNVVAKPNNWQKQVRAATQRSAVAGKGALYLQFWPKLLDRVHAEHPNWTRSRRASTENRIEMPSPFRRTTINLSFSGGDRLGHELLIRGGDGEQNLQLFEHLRGQREAFEAAYGRTLEWAELQGYRLCLIGDYRPASSVTDETEHDRFIDWFLDAGLRLRCALAAIEPPR
jgi:Domain of unknown function (DUF4268)